MDSLQVEKKKSRTEEEETPIFPPEIITEIASRLPAKSLGRFKTVSKPWLLMISDPKFVKLHITRTRNHKIFFASNRAVYSSDPKSLDDDLILAKKIKNYPLKNPDPNRSVQLYGSSNGLICICPPINAFYTYYIYNPTTGESKDMPDPMTCMKILAPPHIYGFGYSPALDDYKFIKIVHGVVIWVYSLKSNTWKTASEKFPYNPPYIEPGTPLNGCIHWVQSRGTLVDHYLPPTTISPWMEIPYLLDAPQSAKQKKLPYKCVIAAFDLADDRFVDIPAPNPDMDYRKYALGLLDGKLCLMHHKDEVHNEFWIMKEYGVKESWNRIVISLGYFTLRPLCFAEDGDNKGALMVINQNRLVLVNVANGACLDLRVKKMRGRKFESDVIQETLASPTGF